jgi:hypothetical protein
MGGFLKTTCEDLDKVISERDWDDPRQNIHAHPSIKGFFYPLLQTNQPIIHQRSAQIGIHRVIWMSIEGIRG